MAVAATVFSAQRDYRRGAGELGEGERRDGSPETWGRNKYKSERRGGGGRGVAICDRRAAIKSSLPYFPRNKCCALPTSLLPLTLRALLWPKLGIAEYRKMYVYEP